MDTLKILGQRIRALRIERGKKQREIAEYLEMSLRNYQRFEHGDLNLPALTLCTLADYFGVSTDYLLGRSEEKSGGPKAPEKTP